MSLLIGTKSFVKVHQYALINSHRKNDTSKNTGDQHFEKSSQDIYSSTTLSTFSSDQLLHLGNQPLILY